VAGERFLSEEAPRVPLHGCDQPQCLCRLVPVDDRRSDRDRRDRFSAYGDIDPELDRKHHARGPDRRR